MHAVTRGSRLLVSHPFAWLERFSSSFAEELPGPATALSLGSPRGSPRQEDGRCYGPTSATDLTTRALVNRPIPMLAVARDDRRPVRPRSRSPASSLARGAEPPCGNPAMGEHAFDDAHPASASSRAAHPPKGAVAEHHTGAPIAAAFSTANEVCDSASDTRCRPLVEAARTSRMAHERARAASTAPSSKREAFPGSECLSSTGAPRTPLSRTPRKPATDLAALPPSSRLPACFHHHGAMRLMARPRVDITGSSPASARGHTPPVDFCNQRRSTSTTADDTEPRARHRRLPADKALSRVTGLPTNAASRRPRS